MFYICNAKHNNIKHTTIHFYKVNTDFSYNTVL